MLIHTTPFHFLKLDNQVLIHSKVSSVKNVSLSLAAVYFVIVATLAALVGQHVVRKMVSLLKRASLIIFILAFTIFASAVSLGM